MDVRTAATMTAAELLALADPEATYRVIRDEMAHDYSTSVGPHAERQRRHGITKRRDAGGHHAEQAAGDERRLEDDVAEYDAASRCKTALAILTGRYDSVLVLGEEHHPYLLGTSVPSPVLECEAARREVLARPESAALVARLLTERRQSDGALAELDRQRLTYPPVGWGVTRHGTYAARQAAWQERAERDRLGDASPREVPPA